MNDLGCCYPSEETATMLKNTTDINKNKSLTDEYHQSAKNKVGEFVAIRALARPLKPEETRELVKTNASETVASLGADLPTKLGLLLAA